PDFGNYIHQQQPQILQHKCRMIARPGWKLLDAIYPRNLVTFARCFTGSGANLTIIANLPDLNAARTHSARHTLCAIMPHPHNDFSDTVKPVKT
ncbi:MAG: hypothetical protein ACRYG8_20620, partial [Janthinobacterium lividum]